MEAILGALVLVLVMFGGVWAVRDRPPGRGNLSETPPARPAPPAPSRHPAPFDAKTAKRLAPARSLTGAAWVIDGDTIRLGKVQIRLFGIDAPELNHPYGQKAKWALHRMCKGHVIRAEITDRDAYGRTVARCFLPDGRDLSAEMVRQGLALDWAKFSNGTYRRLETADARKRLFLADARQKGHMQVWARFEARQANR